MGLKNKLFCRMAYAIRSAFFFFFFLTSYQSEKDGSELTPSCWKSLSFPCSRKADILKPKLGTFSPSQCCGWHKAGQFSLLHSLQSFIFSCPSCLEDDFLNPASRFFCWWALRSSSGAVFLSSFGVPRGQLQIGISVSGPAFGQTSGSTAGTSSRSSWELSISESLQRFLAALLSGYHSRDLNKAPEEMEPFFWTASWVKMPGRDLRVFFPQLCVTDLQQTILSSFFLSVMWQW